jgi:hypothetical protein
MTRYRRLGNLVENVEEREEAICIADNPVLSIISLDDDAKQSPHTLTDYKKDWLLWIEDWLHICTTPWPDDYPPDNWDYERRGYPLWSKQVDIIKALQDHHKVAVRSSFGIGKTFQGGILVPTVTAVERALTITTGPNFRQIKRQLWGEVHKIYNRAESINKQNGKTIGAQLNKTSLEFDSGKWFAEGFSTDKSYNFQGFHETTLFLIVDEAGQVDRDSYDIFDAILTNDDTYVLLIGNPVDPHNEFRNCFKPGSKYYSFKIDSFQTPNVKHKKNIFPFLVSYDWPEMMLKKYKGDKEHPKYMSNVLAEFPKEGEDQLITWDLLEKAMERNLDPKSPIISLGNDVARKGSDFTVYGYRQANGRFRIYRETEQERETETAARLALDLRNQNPDLPVDPNHICANIEDLGTGGGVCDILIEQDLPINEIAVGGTPEEWREDYELFLNKRAYYYWQLRQAFIDGNVDIDPDDIDLIEELHAIQKQYSSKDGGKIKMISKDDLRTKLGRSPDKADTMMLAFAESEADNRRNLIREL